MIYPIELLWKELVLLETIIYKYNEKKDNITFIKYIDSIKLKHSQINRSIQVLYKYY